MRFPEPRYVRTRAGAYLQYGNGDDPIHRLCLHAYMLCFTHPVTHERMEFETLIPTAFRMLFK